MINQIIHGDCLEVLRDIPDNSINLICTDPPYFKVKSDWWDRQWEKPEDFLEWIDKIAEQWQRILKPNGSLYCFADPKMSARVEVKLSERFNIVNRITWQKPPFSTKAEMVVKQDLRSFFAASESIIFCEHYGADNIAKGEAGYAARCNELRGFVFEPLRAYLDSERKRGGITSKQIIDATKCFTVERHAFQKSQFELPTLERYTLLQQSFPGYFTRPYEELRLQYEELRRPFSVSADVPYTDVWEYPTVSAYPGKHPCEKPSAMLEHIIKSSSREGDAVLDCFAGSGSTLLAAKQLKRDFIGIEIDPHWIDQINQRLGNFSHQPTLEGRMQWLETQVKAQTNKIKKLERQQYHTQLSLFD